MVAQAPCRIDLAGGTVDIWPLYLFHPGAVTVNVAVDIQTTCRITPTRSSAIHLRSLDTGREDSFPNFAALCEAGRPRHALAAHLVRFFRPRGGFRLETHSQAPAGAGISGSSALMISTTAALARYVGSRSTPTNRSSLGTPRLSLEEMRVIAQNVEAQLIRVPTGCQDYYPALYGGVSVLRLEPDAIHREAIPVPPAELESRVVLVYTGAPRQSGINNWEVFKAHIDGQARVRRNFQRIVEIAQAMATALRACDWPEIERLLGEEWKQRKRLAPGISTPFIDRLIQVAARAGGSAAKVCGAGGGGCVVFLAEPDARDAVEQALAKAGANILPFRVAVKGLRVSSSQGRGRQGRSE